MTYQNDDRISVVKHIQTLLRDLEINNGSKVTVPIDGIYGIKTKEAVGKFQEENGLNVTGEVDRDTYDLLYKLALQSEINAMEPLPIYLLKNGQSVSKGEKSDFVTILQIILNALTVSYDDFQALDLSGEFDTSTENAVRRFQKKNAISPSGIVDKETWNALVRNYNKHISYS